MSEPFATLDEYKRLRGVIGPIAEDRRAATARMVFTPVAECPVCREAVRRCDSRRLVGDSLHHLDCAKRV